MTATATAATTTGDRTVSRYELAMIPAPRPTATWYPVPHGDVAYAAVSALKEAGYDIRNER